MVQRDEEGRPIATRSAGAFMAPFSGVPPVPTSLVDQGGAAVGQSREADLERTGQRSPGRDADSGSRLATDERRWVLASITAIAVWALCSSLLWILLAATRDWVEAQGPSGAGATMLAIIHEPWFLLVAHLVFLAIGLRVGARFLSSRTARSWLLLLAVLLGGGLLVGAAVRGSGGTGALVVVGCAIAWLIVAYRVRPA